MVLKKSLLACNGLVVMLLITACHKNPLLTHRGETNVTLLRDAAYAAARALDIPPRAAGKAYMHCMDGDKTTPTCKKLFAAMLAYAQKQPAYANLTYQDLTEDKTYIALADDFENKLFATLDY